MTPSPEPPPALQVESELWTCAWCGSPLTAADGVWTDETYGSGDYCPEGRAVGASGTSPHLPTVNAALSAPAADGWMQCLHCGGIDSHKLGCDAPYTPWRRRASEPDTGLRGQT